MCVFIFVAYKKNFSVKEAIVVARPLWRLMSMFGFTHS